MLLSVWIKNMGINADKNAVRSAATSLRVILFANINEKNTIDEAKILGINFPTHQKGMTVLNNARI